LAISGPMRIRVVVAAQAARSTGPSCTGTPGHGDRQSPHLRQCAPIWTPLPRFRVDLEPARIPVFSAFGYRERLSQRRGGADVVSPAGSIGKTNPVCRPRPGTAAQPGRRTRDSSDPGAGDEFDQLRFVPARQIDGDLTSARQLGDVQQGSARGPVADVGGGELPPV
jgi:hypothetical protein